MINENMENMIERVLEAKEERAHYQRKLVDCYKLPLISLTLVLPGGYFQYNKWELILEKAVETIYSTFLKHIIYKEVRLGEWGPEGFWIINLPAETIKWKAINIENEHSLGRLFDIDVIDIKGNSISRRDFNVEPRRCIICDNIALECYVGKKHKLKELKLKVDEIIEKGLILGEE